MQLLRRGRRPDRDGLGQQDRAGVEPLFHLHDADAGLAVAGEDGALDRRRATPARQERGVDIEAAEPGRRQHRLRQDQAIGRHYCRVEAERGELGNGSGVEARRRMHGQVRCLGCLLHGRGLRSLAATGRTRRLAVDGGDVVPGRAQRLEARNGEVRRPHEGETKFCHGVRLRFRPVAFLTRPSRRALAGAPQDEDELSASS